MITTDDFGEAAEIAALEAMVDAFAEEMKAKLIRTCRAGMTGWDDPKRFGTNFLWKKMKALWPDNDHVQVVDIGNYAAMIWNRWQP